MANKEYPWCPFSCLILVNLRFFKIDIEWRKNHFLQNEKRLLPVIFSKGERDERERERERESASKSKSRSSPSPNVKQKLTLITRGVHMGRPPVAVEGDSTPKPKRHFTETTTPAPRRARGLRQACSQKASKPGACPLLLSAGAGSPLLLRAVIPCGACGGAGPKRCEDIKSREQAHSSQGRKDMCVLCLSNSRR